MNSKEIIKKAEQELKEQFEIIDEIRDYNQEKVLNAFIENKVAPEHFYTVSGYGHDDMGREVLDKVFAHVFKAEKAIARIHFASGTHTLACVLFGNPRQSTLALLCALETLAEYVSLHNAALIPRTLFAAIDIPIPVPQMRIPLFAFPLITLSHTERAISG